MRSQAAFHADFRCMGRVLRPGQALLLTVASVTVLVVSNHLAILMAAWFATDVGLHQLLTFYRTRRQAIIVAHKKFLLSRIADSCFISSLVLVGTEVGSLRIDVVNAFAQSGGASSPSLAVTTPRTMSRSSAPGGSPRSTQPSVARKRSGAAFMSARK